ncbi:MAG: hypothetical protein Q8K67_11030 [Geothrix sp.]|nr:hypothetical protein [Geothrix sp.]
MPKSVYHWILVWVIDPSILIPLTAYAWSRLRGGYQHPQWLRPFLWVQILDLAQGIVFIAMALSHRNNQWFRHLIQPFIFTGLLWVLAKAAQDSPQRRRIYISCVGVGILAALAGVFVNGIRWRNALFTTTQSFVFMSLGTYELQRLFTQENDEILTDKPEFWLNTAILIYGSVTLIFSASSNYFLRNLPPHLLPLPWIIHGLILVFYQLFLAKVFLCRRPTSS